MLRKLLNEKQGTSNYFNPLSQEERVGAVATPLACGADENNLVIIVCTSANRFN